MLYVVSILSAIIVSCSADKPAYLSDGVKAQQQTSIDALPQVSVTFDQGSLPAAVATVNSINAYVTSTSGATKYRYALLSGPAAAQGATACAEADYSEFQPLADPIIASDLPEGAQLLCARGKNAAGIAQQAATSHAWKIALAPPADEEPPVEPTPDERPMFVVNFPPAVSPPPPPPPPVESSPPPPPPPPPPVESSPEPEAKMQVKKNDNAGALSHAFSHGDTMGIISYYIHNTGDAELTWSLKLGDEEDVGWLRVTYNGEAKVGSDISFSGTLAANSRSSGFWVGLVSDSSRRVDHDYLAVKKVNGKRVETSEYEATIIFKNENTGATEEATASVYLQIPRLGLKKSSPPRKYQWHLPIANGDHDRKRLYIEKRGKGNLTWRNNKKDYNKFDVTSNNLTNGGHFDVRLRRRGRRDNKPPAEGDHTHMGIISNGGATYVGQSNPGIRWLYVCVVNGNVNTNTRCPEHDPSHHN